MSCRGPSIVWYRGHDLRVEDNPALLAAVQRGGPVLPVFVWAPEEDGAWCLGRPGRWWLQRSLAALDRQIRELGCTSGLIMWRSRPELGGVEAALLELVKQSGAEAIFWNRVYDPVIMRRDEEFRRRWVKRHHLVVESFKAELLVEPWEVGLGDGGTSSLAERALETFHEFMSAWMAMPPPPEPLPPPSRIELLPVNNEGETGFNSWIPKSNMEFTEVLLSPGEESETEIGELWKHPFDADALEEVWQPGIDTVQLRLQHFLERVFPAYGDTRKRQRPQGSTSRLSPYLRYGELSPRRLYHAVRAFVLQCEPSDAIIRAARTLLKNLCMREYGYHLLFYRPSVVDRPLVPEFEHFPYARDEMKRYMEAWVSGQTGYPLVDAAMRELRQTGWLHANMRFLVASFFTKYLLLPWQLGARYLYKTLIDGDLASNSLGWQWVTGCNSDVFPLNCLVNPVVMGMRIDPDGEYVRTWCPELKQIPNAYIHAVWKTPTSVLKQAQVELGSTYPWPIVESQAARRRVREALRYLRQVLLSTRGHVPRTPNVLTLRGTQELMSDWPIDEVYNVLDSKQEDLFGLSDLGPELPMSGQPERPMRDSDASIEDQDMNNDSVGGDHVGLLPRIWSMSQDDPIHSVFDISGSTNGANGGGGGGGGGGGLLGSGTGPFGVNGNGQGAGGNSAFVAGYSVSAGVGGNLPGMVGFSGGTVGVGVAAGGVGGGGGGGSDRSIPEIVLGAPSSVDEDNYTEKMHRVDSLNAMLSASAAIQRSRSTFSDHTGRLSGLGRSRPPELYNGMATMSNTSAAYPYATYMPAHGTRSLAAAAAAAAAAVSIQPSIVGSTAYAGAVASSPSAQHHFGGLSYGHGGAIPAQVAMTLQPQSGNNRSAMGMTAGAAAAGHAPERTAQSALSRATTSPVAGPEPGAARRSGQMHADRGSSGAVYQPADGNDRGFVHSHGEAHPLPSEDEDRTTLTSVGGRKRYASSLMVAGSGDELDVDVAAQSQRTPWSEAHGEVEGVLTTAKPKRRATAAGRNHSAPDTSPETGVSSGQSKVVAGRTTVSRRQERGLENESVEMRSSSASSERVALQPLADLATAEPPTNRAERLLLLERICRSDSEFARFAEYLLRHYDITENVRRDAQSTDFVRLRNIKDDFHRYCASLAPEALGDRERLKIYRIKLFFSKVLNLEVTGEWDRHAHGGVRGPYVYGLVVRSNLTP